MLQLTRLQAFSAALRTVSGNSSDAYTCTQDSRRNTSHLQVNQIPCSVITNRRSVALRGQLPKTSKFLVIPTSRVRCMRISGLSGGCKKLPARPCRRTGVGPGSAAAHLRQAQAARAAHAPDDREHQLRAPGRRRAQQRGRAPLQQQRRCTQVLRSEHPMHPSTALLSKELVVFVKWATPPSQND